MRASRVSEGWRIIAGTYRDALHAIGTHQLDLVEGSIVL
jgi:hypothetical protein